MTTDTNEPSEDNPEVHRNGYDNRAFVEDTGQLNGNSSRRSEPENGVQNGNDIGLRGMRNGSTRNSNRRDNGTTNVAMVTMAVDDGSNSGAVHLPAGSPPGDTPDCENPKTEIGTKDSSEDSARCGISMFRPKWLQKFRTAKWALFWLCWAGTLQGMVVNGFVNVVITTIERRFGLRSSQTGLIAGGYDMASFICLTPVTYLGGRKGASKPRWIGLGVVLMGLGSLLFTLPHFAAGKYNVPGEYNNNCRRLTNLTDHMSRCGNMDSQMNEQGILSGSSGAVLMVFLGAQLLHGAGASPLFTLGVTYIDENVSKKMSSVYIGIFYTMSIIGPAVGYVVGGQLLQIYQDFLFVNPNDLGLSPDNNGWIGAWWIGFLLSTTLCFTVAIPLLAFPPSLPGASELQKKKVSEAYDGDSSKTQAFTKIRELPHAFGALIKNPTFFFLNLAGASEGLILSGFSAFLPKLIENQFSVSASWAAMLMGMVTVPAGGGGTFLGGYLVKRLKLQCAGIIKLCISVSLLSLLFACGFFVSCSNLSFAGLTQSYGYNTSPNPDKMISMDSACNQGCSCSRELYDPICGIDGVMYYSPCYAGCKQKISTHDSKVYTHCTCIKPKMMNFDDASFMKSNTTSNTLDYNDKKENTIKINDKIIEYEAINTLCKSDCQYLGLFMLLTFMCMLFTFLATMPALSATLRCVRDDQRSFALGIQWIKVRLLGTIPAPMIFGVLIDKACILWQNSCDGKGNCLVYNNLNMSRYMVALALVAKMCSLLFFFSAWWFYKAPQHTKMKSVPSVNIVQSDMKQNNHAHTNGCSNNEIINERF